MALNVATTVSANVVKLPSYTVVIQMNMGSYSFELLTNYEFIAVSKEAALKVAADMLKELIPFVEVYYDLNLDGLKINIKDNKYFDCAEIRNFEIYDESQIDFVSNKSSISIGLGLNCYSFVTEEKFYEHIEMNTYSSSIIKFEAVGYGIALLN
ncbi:hypothetical protein [Lysinibacillus irui]|uniref:Uncharacterized protein n=1 Tax=Lysinibacillus irui TaxID=2998077 RepID=A0AAJ5RQU9_9BACI|nr:hypothetical protein [Lysinibacillus irui]WDV09300.1 hypothetical protein OU989_22515 [Lysinibacillus irui]